MSAIAIWFALQCMGGQPSQTVKGWMEISGWVLPGDDYSAAYVCSGTKRRLVVQQLTGRSPDGIPSFRYVMDMAAPNDLIEAGECTRNGKPDPYVVAFGSYGKDGIAHVKRAWRIDLEKKRFVSVKPSTLKCEAANERD